LPLTGIPNQPVWGVLAIVLSPRSTLGQLAKPSCPLPEKPIGSPHYSVSCHSICGLLSSVQFALVRLGSFVRCIVRSAILMLTEIRYSHCWNAACAFKVFEMYPIQLPIPSQNPPRSPHFPQMPYLVGQTEMASQHSLSLSFGGLKSGCVFTCNDKEVSIGN